MTLNHRLILLLLLGLTITLVAASPCTLSEDTTRCVCNIQSIRHPDSQICFIALELELRDSKLDQMDVALDQEILQQTQINKLILNNDTISFSFISAVISSLNSKLNEIHIISSTLEAGRTQLLLPPQVLVESKITVLLLEDVSVDPSLLQPSLQTLHDWLFSSLKSLHLVRSGLVEIGCYWAQRAANLNHLDLSENPISYTGLQNISSCLPLSFKSLKTLHLRRTNLTSLQSLCTPLSLAPAIHGLDVSGNDFSIFDFPSCLQGKLLRTLDLSHSMITEVKSLLSASLEELDLSYNYLEIFNNPPQSLKKLCLSNNRLIRLPSLDNMSQLKELKVDSNQLTVLINDTDVNLGKLEQLDVLRAGRNPYQCDCTLKETVIFLDSADRGSVEDYPDDFLCASPAAQQGSQIMKLSLESCVKPTSGTQRLRGSPLCLTLFVGLLPHLIYFC